VSARAQDSKAPAKPYEDVNPKNFDHPTVIDNPWMPMKPGTRLSYQGTTIEDDGTAVPHKVVITITDLTKVISGIRTVVSWDLDYSDGQLVEAEVAFFAPAMGDVPETGVDLRVNQLAAAT
jgi:hypothetical protein